MVSHIELNCGKPGSESLKRPIMVIKFRPDVHAERVVNIISGRAYFVATGPELDFWTTNVFPVTERRRCFGLTRREEPDVKSKVQGFVRNDKTEAFKIHADVVGTLKYIPESDWIRHFPDPSPPDGYSDAARKKFKEEIGLDMDEFSPD